MERDRVRKLARIIVQVRLKNVSDADRAYLNDWLDEDERNRTMYRRIVRGECIARRIRQEDEISKSVNYIEVEKSVIHLLKNRKRERWFRIGSWGGTVAACLIGVVWYVTFGERENAGMVNDKPLEQIYVASFPEKNLETVLVLADGSKIDLERQVSRYILQENVIIEGEKGQLAYREQEKIQLESEMLNKVITGKEGYFLSLSDGTRVWLNGNSELEFPVSFVKDERVVTLRGEAYFEVARDVESPFIVQTRGLYTKVLGTSFNVKAYDDEPEVSTTLLSGKVEVCLPGDVGDSLAYATLSPGMQARVYANRNEIALRKVVAEDAIAWREGKFIFTDEEMSVVLHVLARWYGVNFIQEGKCRDYTFSGMVSRDEQLTAVLEMLTIAGGPRFDIKGKNVYIKEK